MVLNYKGKERCPIPVFCVQEGFGAKQSTYNGRLLGRDLVPCCLRFVRGFGAMLSTKYLSLSNLLSGYTGYFVISFLVLMAGKAKFYLGRY